MAKLPFFEDLSLEIRHRSFERGWVFYDIWLRWRGEPIFNDATLKRSPASWAPRGEGAMTACEPSECAILPLIKQVLATNESDLWESMEPDIVFAIYAEEGFPFLRSRSTVFESAFKQSDKRWAAEANRPGSTPLPDDIFEMILFFDSYTFRGAGAYLGSGVCFRLVTTRAQLSRFYRDLRAEYVEFREEWDIEALNRASDEEDYMEPDF